MKKSLSKNFAQAFSKGLRILSPLARKQREIDLRKKCRPGLAESEDTDWLRQIREAQRRERIVPVKDPYQIVRYPLITEKSTILRENKNKYTFRVDKRANKIEIKRAIEAIFPDVEVVTVNTLNVRGKPKSLRYNKRGKRPDWKKAVVTLRPEDRIDIYETL